MNQDKLIEEAIKTREEWKKGDAHRDHNKRIPSSVKRIRNITYGPYGEWNLLDINYPKDKKIEDLPIIVSCHGGGYFYGTTDIYQFYCADLAERGFCVINFNYRLSPENKYPSPIEDTNAVMNFLIAHQREYGFDLNRIFMVGDSAGANLVVQMAALYSNLDYQKLFPNIDFAKIQIKGISPNCGFYDWKALGDDSFAMEYQYFEGGSAPESASFENYINDSYPPTFVATCNNDFLRGHGKPFYDLLISRDVKAQYRLYDPKRKKLNHVHHVDVGHKYADIWNDEECEFFLSLEK